jgi:hypothetical protein
MGKDELSQAASSGDIEGLCAAIKLPGIRPELRKSQTALVCAAEANQLEAVKVLLEWGTPAGSEDESRRRALHIACGKGYLQVVRELVKKSSEADITAIDSEGNSPLGLAVATKHLAICKVLLKAGAKLQTGQSCKGLAAIVEEVQAEVLVDELKAYASTPDLSSELLEADGEVWKAQKEQMRLTVLKEEQKVGSSLIDLEQRLESETEVYYTTKGSEEALAKELADLRVNLQTAETATSLMQQQLETAEMAAREAARAEEEGDVEYKALLAELTKMQSEKDEADKLIATKEMSRDEALAEGKELQEEACAMKHRNKAVSDELKAESVELKNTEREREAAAALTAQAHQLLGVKERLQERKPQSPSPPSDPTATT